MATPRENATVAVFDSHVQTEAAIASLRHSEFDLGRVSVAAVVRNAEERVAGCYNDGGSRIKYWGEGGTFWRALWEALPGWGFFTTPGIGPVLVAGPLASWIVAGLENAPIFGGLSAFGAGIYSIGIPKEQIPIYETALKAGKYLVLVHGGAAEVSRAREILKSGS
jgi:hypothetical protein